MTAIIDPSKKDQSMNNWRDFLAIKTSNTLIQEINLENVKKYRDYRLKNGLLQIW